MINQTQIKRVCSKGLRDSASEVKKSNKLNKNRKPMLKKKKKEAPK